MSERPTKEVHPDRALADSRMSADDLR